MTRRRILSFYRKPVPALSRVRHRLPLVFFHHLSISFLVRCVRPLCIGLFRLLYLERFALLAKRGTAFAASPRFCHCPVNLILDYLRSLQVYLSKFY